MTDLARWPHADDLLDRALALPREARSTFIRDVTAGDAALAAALEAILAEDDEADPFLVPGGAATGPLATALARDAADDEQPRLQAGQTFGGYDVVGVLGHGGMGEVYRARDPRLGRDVALKVLPARFADHADRQARLEREARLLASLNDRHIAAIYEIDEHEGVVALVLELVDGPTLAERLTRGRLPIPEAIDVAEQVARALVAAHRRGIAHRDLKPANIKVGPDGLVKVLDFGIATALADGPDTAPDAAARLTADHGGPIFGTAAYISPERARGQQTDHRADIWAYGCVLFEMLTGARAFDAPTPGDTLARVLEREPDYTRLPARTPAALRRLLDRTLRKDPERRLGYVGDALLDLEDAREEFHGAVEAPSASRRSPGTAWAMSAGLALGLAIGGGVAWNWLQPDPLDPVHLAIPIPEVDDLIAGEVPGVAISPDGRHVVYRSRREGVIQLVRRPIGENVATPIEGSVNGSSPFFSPDGQWIGFSSESGLMKIPTAGGKPTDIASTPGGARASWGDDGSIWFSTGTTRVLHRISPSGGAPEEVTTLDGERQDQTHSAPSALPGGDTALFVIARPDGPHIAAARAGAGVVATLGPGRQPQALPDGRFVFVRGDSLWQARLNLRTLALDEEPEELRGGLELSAQNATAHFAVASNGALVFLPRQPSADDRLPIWVHRDGREESIPIEPRPYTRAAVSPDGTRIALAVAAPENRDVWIYEFARRALMRLTVDPANDTAPVWSPDGRRIAFRSEREGGGIFIKSSDGAGPAERLTRSDGPARPAHTPYSFTPDGGQLVFAELRSYTDQGISAVTVDASPAVSVILDGPYAEARPALSPDGRWLAYQSDESGRYEIYVRPYPQVDAARMQVSTTGGTSPRWTPDGRELVYFDGTSMVSAALASGPALKFAAPVVLFDASLFAERLGPVYDIAPDGRRFLFLKAPTASGQSPRRAELIYVR